MQTYVLHSGLIKSVTSKGNEVILMSDEEYRKSEEFSKNIYQKILTDWSAPGSIDSSSGELTESCIEFWLKWSESCRVPLSLGQKWSQIFESINNESGARLPSESNDASSLQAIKPPKSAFRVSRFLADVQTALTHEDLIFKPFVKKDSYASLPHPKDSNREMRAKLRTLNQMIAVYGLLNWIAPVGKRRTLSKFTASKLVVEIIAEGGLDRLHAATMPLFYLLKRVAPITRPDHGIHGVVPTHSDASVNSAPAKKSTGPPWVIVNKMFLPNSLTTDLVSYYNISVYVCCYSFN